MIAGPVDYNEIRVQAQATVTQDAMNNLEHSITPEMLAHMPTSMMKDIDEIDQINQAMQKAAASGQDRTFIANFYMERIKELRKKYPSK